MVVAEHDTGRAEAIDRSSRIAAFIPSLAQPRDTQVQASIPARVFQPGVEVSQDELDRLQLSPDQLRLERNLLFRDINPRAHFNDPQLEANIDRITGSKGDSVDPANQATKMEIGGLTLTNAQRLMQYEATARINEWRNEHKEQMLEANIPARRSDEQIAQVSNSGIQEAINDFYAEKGFPFSGSRLQNLYRQLKDYEPNPKFDDRSFSVEDRVYLNKLVARRSELKELPD